MTEKVLSYLYRVDDIAQADMLAEAMRVGQEERMQAIVERIKKVKEAKSERQRNP